MNRFRTLIALFLSIFVTTLYINNVKSVDAHRISPSIQEYTLAQGESIDGSFNFFNSEDKEITIISKSYSYDPKKSSLIADSPLTFVNSPLTTVAAQGEAQINFTIKLDTNIKPGTYFNVISNEELGSNTKDLGLIPGFGELIVIHVIDGEDVKGIHESFLRESSLVVEVIDKGFPYIQDTKIRVTYTNNSPYALKPTGEVRLVQKDPTKVVKSFRINPDLETIYSGEKIVKEYKSSPWKISNSFKGISAIAQVQLTEGDTGIQFENQISIKREMRIIISLISTPVILIVAYTIYKRRILKTAITK